MNRRGLGTGIVEPQDFQKATIARRLFISSHNAVRGLALETQYDVNEYEPLLTPLVYLCSRQAREVCVKGTHSHKALAG